MLNNGANNMVTGHHAGVLHHCRRAAFLHDGGGLTDGQLLECFIHRREEAAFEALVRRHGPMVLGVCRRVLAHDQDAEDAFQATFLVLVRKAASLTARERVGNWLYGVAYRVALQAKAARPVKEKQVNAMPEPEAVAAPDLWSDLRPILDHELSRLPDKYRLAIVLCDLEGRTRQEVARQFGIPAGTLSGRLTTARRLLAGRLARHGLALGSAGVATALSPGAALARVPASLVVSTVKAATHVAMGGAAATVVSARAAALSEGVLRTMLRIKLTATVLPVALGLLCLLACSFVAGVAADPVGAAGENLRQPRQASQPAPAADAQKLLGAWKVTTLVYRGKALSAPGSAVKEYLYITKDLIYRKSGDEVRDVLLYQIDTTQKPKAIDLRSGDGTKDFPAIYEMKGDDLKLCIREKNDDKVERPTTFASKPGSTTILITLKRDLTAPKLDMKKVEAQLKAIDDRRASAKNLRKLALAMHMYHADHGCFPPAANCDKDGKPLLSWRVALLPYLNEQALYNNFKLDQPWDSAHNKKLLDSMPALYGIIGEKTVYQVFTGPSTVFDGPRGVKQGDITGLDRVVLIVEADTPLPWTKPQDMPYDATKPLPRLGGLFQNGFHVATGDGAVRFVSRRFNEKVFRNLIIRDSNKAVSWDQLDR
jgi:RNA polymerase sigma factor (sigma-70 family)